MKSEPVSHAREVVHLAPVTGNVTRCCKKAVFEIPLTDRMTNDADLVTCGKLREIALELLDEYRHIAWSAIDEAFLLAGERKAQEDRLAYQVAIYRERIEAAT